MAERDWSWSGRAVAITGAGGFIGSHLAESLVRAGASVRAMVRYNGRSDIGALALVEPDVRRAMDVIPADVTDPAAVRRFVGESDVVFHLAALVAIPFSYVAPASYVATNVGGTLNVLEAVRDLGIPRMVQTSTSETYGTARYTPIDENHPLQPQSPYSASKIGADSLAESFHRSFGTPVAIIRPFNTYGPRQSTRAVVPTIALQVLSGRRPVELGDLRPVRDLTYVEDTVRGFLVVASSDDCIGRVTNIGTGRGISVGDLALAIAAAAGSPEPEITQAMDRMRPPESEVFELVADASRAAEFCGWKPKVTLEAGLRRAVAYYRSNQARYTIDRFTL